MSLRTKMIPTIERCFAVEYGTHVGAYDISTYNKVFTEYH